MHLNLFTNCTALAPDIELIKATYESFLGNFGAWPFTIYVDPSPHREAYPAYLQNLYDYFGGTIIETTGLADGYIQSIENGTVDYLFQLEHDWLFQNIEHNIVEIMELMRRENLNYLRFNKHENRDFEWLRKWQSFLIEKESGGIKYCLTDNISNNPHIVNREYYLNNIVARLERTGGSGGVEQNLEKKDIVGAVYGGLGYPPTITHTDGKRSYL